MTAVRHQNGIFLNGNMKFVTLVVRARLEPPYDSVRNKNTLLFRFNWFVGRQQFPPVLCRGRFLLFHFL